MKKIIYILIFVFASSLVNSQNLLDQALKAYQDQDFENAMKFIEGAVVNETFANDPYAWHLKGYIYKDYFKKIENEKSDSKNREIAIAAFSKSKELDEKGEYIDNNLGNIKYLAICYYNDAVRSMDTASYKKAESYYENYKKFYVIFDASTDFSKNDIAFYNALATVSTKRYDSKNPATDKYFTETIETFEKVLKIDSTECFANEQTGILYYNKGVDLIMNIDIETIDPEEISRKQDECNEYWKISLPYLLRAYRSCPGDNKEKYNIIEGIKGIYWGFDMKDNYDHWDQLQKKEGSENGDK